jgi:hypothetical protein
MEKEEKVQLFNILKKIRTGDKTRDYFTNRGNFTDPELQSLYNAWNMLDEGDKLALEQNIKPATQSPTSVLLQNLTPQNNNIQETLYNNIQEDKTEQILFAFNELVKLFKMVNATKPIYLQYFSTPIEQKIGKIENPRKVANAEQSVATQVGELMRSSVDRFIIIGNDFITQAKQLRGPLDIQPDTNFLKLNAVLISETIILIINFMLLIFCCLLQLSTLLSREDIQSSPDYRDKISLLGKALMQYYTNFLTLIASLIGVPNISKPWLPNTRELTWFETCVIIVVFICIRIVLHNIDPNDIIIQVVMFPILGPVYCADVGLKISGYNPNSVSMFLSRVVWLDNVIISIPETIKNASYEAALHWVKNKTMYKIKDIIIEWLRTDGTRIISENMQKAVEGAVQDVVPQITGAVTDVVTDVVRSEFQDAAPQITGAVTDVVRSEFQRAIPQITAAAQTNLLEFREILSHGLDSCQVITQQQAEILARISDDPTTLEQFSRSLSWWGNLVQENAIKALIQGALAVRGNPQIGYRGGRKTRKYRKNYKNKTKIYRKKQTHKRYRKKTKKGKKSKKY